eukprot:5162325-Pleurochrysis_carterae.AAC.1
MNEVAVFMDIKFFEATDSSDEEFEPVQLVLKLDNILDTSNREAAASQGDSPDDAAQYACRCTCIVSHNLLRVPLHFATNW